MLSNLHISAPLQNLLRSYGWGCGKRGAGKGQALAGFGAKWEIAVLCAETIVALAQKLTEGEDFYFNEQGLMVLTAKYLLKRGYCCRNACRNCPYGFRKEVAEKQKKV